MNTIIVYYVVNSKELTYEAFQKLQVKPKIPYNPNFKEVRIMAEKLKAEKILIDTDNQQIVIK